jgi:hypothetical protein
VSLIVDHLMEEFWSTGIVQRTNSGSPTSKGKEKQADHATGNTAPPSSSSRKRQYDDQDESGEDKDGSPSRPRKYLTPPNTSIPAAKFACPFRKHDPGKYSIHIHRVCSLTPWDSLARLK